MSGIDAQPDGQPPPYTDASHDSRVAMAWILHSLDVTLAATWADRLLNRFGTIASVLAADVDSIADALDGRHDAALYIYRYRAVMIHAAQSQLASTPIVQNSDQLVAFLRLEMGHLKLEQIRALFLDSRQCLIANEVLATGTINEVQLYPRQIAKRAVVLDAAGVILVHNHPAGNPRMSPADRAMTFAVDEGCRAVGVCLHDHLVIARTGHSSFRQDNPLWARG